MTSTWGSHFGQVSWWWLKNYMIFITVKFWASPVFHLSVSIMIQNQLLIQFELFRKKWALKKFAAYTVSALDVNRAPVAWIKSKPFKLFNLNLEHGNLLCFQDHHHWLSMWKSLPIWFQLGFLDHILLVDEENALVSWQL